MTDLKIEYLPVTALKPYERNPRKVDRAVDYVANSIREFGFDLGDVGKVIQEEIGVKTHKCPKCGCEWTARDL